MTDSVYTIVFMPMLDVPWKAILVKTEIKLMKYLHCGDLLQKLAIDGYIKTKKDCKNVYKPMKLIRRRHKKSLFLMSATK